jgi:hypothetical protein
VLRLRRRSLRSTGSRVGRCRKGVPRPIIGDFQRRDTCTLQTAPFIRPSLSSLPIFLSLDIPLFLFPIFFGLTARVIPLRSGLRAFCFHGSSPESMGPSHKADASLRLHAPSLSLVPERTRGRKKGKRKYPIYMLSGIAPGEVRSPTLPSLEHDLLSLPTLGTEACDAVGGAFRPQWREWPAKGL